MASGAKRPDCFKKLLERLAREASNLRLEQAALDARSELGVIKNRFLVVAFGALLGDRLSRLVRTFENSKDTASFWYLHRCDPTIEKKIDVQRLRVFSSKIRGVRNATFTHIDKKFVSDSQKAYREAGLTESEVGFAIDSIWRVVSDLWVEQFGRPLTQVDQAGLKDLMRDGLLQLVKNDRIRTLDRWIADAKN